MKLILRESGAFFTTYNNDSKIMNKLFGYRVVKGRVGFPKDRLNTVLSVLNDKKIEYVVYGKEEEVLYETTFDNNHYEYYLKQAEKLILMDNRINRILLKIRTADVDKLDGLLNLIEEYLNGEEVKRI